MANKACCGQQYAPGWADTPGVQSALPGFRRITQTILRSSEEGADTIVWLARAREAADISGKLFLDREPRTTHLRKSTKEPGRPAISCPGYVPLMRHCQSRATVERSIPNVSVRYLCHWIPHMNPALEPFTPTFDHALIESTRERLARLDFPRPKRLRIGSKVFRCIIVRSWCATGQRITTGNAFQANSRVMRTS